MAPKTPPAVIHPRMSKKGPFSVEVTGVEKVEGETLPRRNPNFKDGLAERPDPSVGTLYDMVVYAAEKYGDTPCVGTRKLLDTHTEKKMVKKIVDGKDVEVEKEWKYFELGPYTFMSFREFRQHVSSLGAGLRKLGLERGDRIHLYGATSMNQMSMAQGAFTQSLAIVTAYEMLGLAGLRSSLEQAQSKAIFLDSNLLPIFSQALEGSAAVKIVVLNDASEPDKLVLQDFKASYPDIHVISFPDLKKLGQNHVVLKVPPGPDDLACIMYTSGTSGTPNGVTIKHKAIVAAVAGATAIYKDMIMPGERVLSYLPQAHITAFLFEMCVICLGGTMGYGSPKTLTDTSVRNCKGDLGELQPVFIIGVPAVWELVKKGIQNRIESGSAFAQRLFWGAYHAKQTLLAYGLPGVGLLDALVFSKTRAATGGKLRGCLTGGGPIARDTQVFISMTIAPLLGGYGMTESCGIGALCEAYAWNPDVIGNIPGAVEMKLVDFADAGYLTSNDPPQGEIWIRGTPITTGFIGMTEEEGQRAFPDGWLMTGDIGEFAKNGQLKIIDRKKNLVKTLKGEYIALEKLESVYRASPLVANICVYAATDRNQPMAIIVPTEPALVKLANSNGIRGHNLAELVDNKKLNGLVLKELQRAGQRGQLSSLELIDAVVMDKDEWTAENGYLTAAQKILRRKITEKNQPGIDRVYNSTR